MNLIHEPSGNEVNVDARGWEQIVRRGEADKFRRVPTTTMGRGPEGKIVLLLHGNGIGDCIHSLPAISAKLEQGFDITVLAEESVCPFFERAGCKVIPVHSDATGSVWIDNGSILGFIPEHYDEYGTFYSLKHWCVTHDEDSKGNSSKDRFVQFAEFIGVDLPAMYKWREILI